MVAVVVATDAVVVRDVDADIVVANAVDMVVLLCRYRRVYCCWLSLLVAIVAFCRYRHRPRYCSC